MTSTQRLVYIDWMRGLACVLMFQTHCYDSWLSPEARQSALFAYSRLGGTLPAPLFIFLAGLSVALVTEKLRQIGVTRGAIARQVILRGAEVFAIGILFRLQEYLLGIPRVPWTDLLRVDVLNILGISMMLLGAVCWLAGAGQPDVLRKRSVSLALVSCAAVVIVSPALWTSWRLKFLPWPIESYINGVHIFNKPQPWLFPIFPWTAFAFAGLVVGFLLFTEFARSRPPLAFVWMGCSGVVIFLLALALDRSPLHLPGEYDFWHTSPNFFLVRCGILLVTLFLAYAWCAWGWGQFGFSPLVQLGKTSLLVYWVHIEFVYGRFSILPKGKCSIGLATAGLSAIFLGMLALSRARTWWKERRGKDA